MNYFEMKKKEAIDFLKGNASDNSQKGKVDVQIKPLLEVINGINEFYTTSSCAGRINLLQLRSGKNDSDWIYMTHKVISLDSIDEICDLIKSSSGEIWFKMESPILHVCASSLDYADKFLHIANMSGFKRSGIISTSKRIMIECLSTEKVEIPFRYKDELLIDDNLKSYLTKIIKISNKRLKRSRKKIANFEEKLKNNFAVSDYRNI